MKVLILSFYFHPDLSAGSFRSSALVKALECQLPRGSQIDVVTTLPNRYPTFTVDAPELERRGGIEIRRIALPSHKSGMVDQSNSFLAFSRQVIRHVEQRRYDLVFATSSRLMTAVLGAWIASRKGALLYLDIRDIFVETINDVLPKYLAFSVKPVFALLERLAVNRAVRVNLVSRGFADYFSIRYPNMRFSYYTNGIDEEFIAAASEIDCTEKAGCAPLQVVYAGNIGEGQGLHAILPALANRMGERLHFKVIGDGGRKEALRSALSAAGAKNVELLPPMKRDALIEVYRRADILFLHLNDYAAFSRVLPSKLFEYAAMGKPIWAGVAGYAAKFVRTEIANAAVFSPCNAAEAELVFSSLELRDRVRVDFIEKYARGNLSASMAEEIIEVAQGAG